MEPDFDVGLHSHQEPIDEKNRPKMIEHVKKLLKVIDHDGDGQLSIHEIKKHVSDGVRRQMANEEDRLISEGKNELDAAIEKKDSDKDGLISKDEMFQVSVLSIVFPSLLIKMSCTGAHSSGFYEERVLAPPRRYI